MDTEAKQLAQSDQNKGAANPPRRLSETPSKPQPASQQFRRYPLSATPLIAFLIVAVSAVIGGLCFDQAALSKPSDGMADNPAVRDFAKAIELIEGNYAVTADKERLTRGAVLGM